MYVHITLILNLLVRGDIDVISRVGNKAKKAGDKKVHEKGCCYCQDFF